MAETHDLASPAAAASTAIAHYLLGASVRSARTLHLFEQVVGCVARQQLDPDALRDMLTRTLEASGAAFATKAAESKARFLASLSTSTWLPADDAAPPAFEPADPIGWFGKLGAYAAERNARATLPDRQSMGTFLKNKVPEHLGQVARGWFELLGELEELRAGFMEEYLQAVLAKVRPIGFHAGVLDLAASLGQISSAELHLENERDERVSIRCAASDVRRADGIGPAFRPDISVSPLELLLEAD